MGDRRTREQKMSHADAKAIARQFETMRDPNAGLGHRLEALDCLLGRKGLHPEMQESIAVHTKHLATAVIPFGEVKAGAVTYYVDSLNRLRRKLG